METTTQSDNSKKAKIEHTQAVSEIFLLGGSKQRQRVEQRAWSKHHRASHTYKRLFATLWSLKQQPQEPGRDQSVCAFVHLSRITSNTAASVWTKHGRWWFSVLSSDIIRKKLIGWKRLQCCLCVCVSCRDKSDTTTTKENRKNDKRMIYLATLLHYWYFFQKYTGCPKRG